MKKAIGLVVAAFALIGIGVAASGPSGVTAPDAPSAMKRVIFSVQRAESINEGSDVMEAGAKPQFFLRSPWSRVLVLHQPRWKKVIDSAVTKHVPGGSARVTNIHTITISGDADKGTLQMVTAVVDIENGGTRFERRSIAFKMSEFMTDLGSVTDWANEIADAEDAFFVANGVPGTAYVGGGHLPTAPVVPSFSPIGPAVTP